MKKYITDIDSLSYKEREISFYVGGIYQNRWWVHVMMNSSSYTYIKCSNEYKLKDTTNLGFINVSGTCGYTNSRLIDREIIDHVLNHVKQHQR